MGSQFKFAARTLGGSGLTVEMALLVLAYNIKRVIAILDAPALIGAIRSYLQFRGTGGPHRRAQCT